MVDPWKVLGIGPTGEVRDIKKAYAARLKHRHPEDDPEGFQELRQAYEMAVEFARWEKAQLEQMRNVWAEPLPPNLVFPVPGVSPRRVPPPLRSTRSRFPAPPRIPPLVPPEAEWAGQAADELMRQVEQLHDDEEAWTSYGAWKVLLQNEALWNVDTRDAFQQRLIELLAVNASSLPAKVWELLDQEFNWSEQRWSLYRRLPPEQVDRVMDYIEYLADVENAERLCDDGLYREAIEWAEPLALRLKEELRTKAQLILGRSYLEIGSFGTAERILDEVIQANPKCIPAYLLLARVFRSCVQMDRALDRAKDMYLQVLRLDPDHKEAAVELVHVQGELVERARREAAKPQAERELAEQKRRVASPPPPRARGEEPSALFVAFDSLIREGWTIDDRWGIPAAIALWLAWSVLASQIPLDFDKVDVRPLLTALVCMAAAGLVAFPFVWWRRDRSHTVGLNLGHEAARPQSTTRKTRTRRGESHTVSLNVGHGAARRRSRAAPQTGDSSIYLADLIKTLLVVSAALLVIGLILVGGLLGRFK